MAMDINYSPQQYDSFSGNITYEWWCPSCGTYHQSPYYTCPYVYGTDPFNYKWWCQKCLVFHYTLDCPIENYERLANLWKEKYYKFCPHCGQLIKKEV